MLSEAQAHTMLLVLRLTDTIINSYTKVFQARLISNGKGKGKPVPLQAWSGPEGSRNLRFPDYMTTLGWISRGWDVGMWTGLGWHRIGTGGGRL